MWAMRFIIEYTVAANRRSMQWFEGRLSAVWLRFVKKDGWQKPKIAGFWRAGRALASFGRIWWLRFVREELRMTPMNT
jgi:hypothetical protein